MVNPDQPHTCFILIRSKILLAYWILGDQKNILITTMRIPVKIVMATSMKYISISITANKPCLMCPLQSIPLALPPYCDL